MASNSTTHGSNTTEPQNASVVPEKAQGKFPKELRMRFRTRFTTPAPAAPMPTAPATHVPKTVQEAVPESVEKAIPDAIHDTIGKYKKQ